MELPVNIYFGKKMSNCNRPSEHKIWGKMMMVELFCLISFVIGCAGSNLKNSKVISYQPSTIDDSKVKEILNLPQDYLINFFNGQNLGAFYVDFGKGKPRGALVSYCDPDHKVSGSAFLDWDGRNYQKSWETQGTGNTIARAIRFSSEADPILWIEHFDSTPKHEFYIFDQGWRSVGPPLFGEPSFEDLDGSGAKDLILEKQTVEQLDYLDRKKIAVDSKSMNFTQKAELEKIAPEILTDPKEPEPAPSQEIYSWDGNHLVLEADTKQTFYRTKLDEAENTIRNFSGDEKNIGHLMDGLAACHSSISRTGDAASGSLLAAYRIAILAHEGLGQIGIASKTFNTAIELTSKLRRHFEGNQVVNMCLEPSQTILAEAMALAYLRSGQIEKARGVLKGNLSFRTAGMAPNSTANVERVLAKLEIESGQIKNGVDRYHEASKLGRENSAWVAEVNQESRQVLADAYQVR